MLQRSHLYQVYYGNIFSITSSQVTLSKCASFLPPKQPHMKIWRLAQKATSPNAIKRFAAQSWEALRALGIPVYDIARDYADIFSEKIPADLPSDRRVRREIVVPGSKYCATR